MNVPGMSQGPAFYGNPYQQIRANNSNSITWVQGIEGAKAYQLMPNSNVILMDSESDKFYIKSSDNIGMCNLRTFNYVEELEKPKEDYVTKAEMESIINQLRDSYEQLIQANNQPVTTKSVSAAPNKCGDGINKK